MKSKRYLNKELFWSASLRLYTPVLFFLVLVALISLFANIPLSRLTRDPLSLGKLNPIFGIVSNFGVLIWCAAASICFFTAILLRKGADKSASKFLFYSGMITLMLLADDFFVIHESLRDYYGISEKITYAVYLGIIGLYLGKFRKLIVNKNIILLILSFGFIGMSVIIDLFQKSVMSSLPGYFLIEDGLKLMGIASWAGYFSVTAIDAVMERFTNGRE